MQNFGMRFLKRDQLLDQNKIDYSIKKLLKKIACEDGWWMQITQDHVQRRVLKGMLVVLNLRFKPDRVSS
jgi:hypothetical protein